MKPKPCNKGNIIHLREISQEKCTRNEDSVFFLKKILIFQIMKTPWMHRESYAFPNDIYYEATKNVNSAHLGGVYNFQFYRFTESIKSCTACCHVCFTYIELASIKNKNKSQRFRLWHGNSRSAIYFRCWIYRCWSFLFATNKKSQQQQQQQQQEQPTIHQIYGR